MRFTSTELEFARGIGEQATLALANTSTREEARRVVLGESAGEMPADPWREPSA